MREEWWWPWGELPRSLKLAAVNLGYDQYSWQAEEFKHSGQRFRDREEVEIERRPQREVEMARGRGVVVEDGAGSACSDSELISGHDAYGLGGCCSGHDGQSRLGGCNFCGCKDTLVLLAEPGRRSSCQGPYAAYCPRGAYHVNHMLEDWCTPDRSYSLRAM